MPKKIVQSAKIFNRKLSTHFVNQIVNKLGIITHKKKIININKK